MKNTRKYLMERLREVENMLDQSARVSSKLFIDDLSRHTAERLELLRERMYLLSVLTHENRSPEC